ncbi:MAG: response regulator transcription factor [Polyangiaceae bacterium]
MLLVDDQPAYREGLRVTLSIEDDLDIVGEAGDGAEALKLARALNPDVVLMDLRMPVMDGVEAIRRLARERPHILVIALTTFDDDALVFDALRAGASSYLLKAGPTAALLRAIRGEEAALSPEVGRKVMAEFRRLSAMVPPSSPLANSLSARELEVVRLLAAGATNKDIAVALNLAEGTVKNHVTRVLEKLEVDDRTQAAIRARELGLVR